MTNLMPLTWSKRESSPRSAEIIEIMEKLLSNGIRHQTVAKKYVFSPEKRPGNLASSCKAVPVIDLQGGDEEEISRKILQAGREFGFFQVVNHGVPEELMRASMGVAQEFFEMSAEDKAIYYSEDPSKIPRLYTSQGYHTEETVYWRDCLSLLSYTIDEDLVHLYPHKPTNFRKILSKYTTETIGLATRLLKLTAKAIGLEEDYFSKKDLSRGPTKISVNHYPPCPDPSLTLGLAKHCDPNLITLVFQGTVSGLQVLHGGEWVAVDPIPNAYVVNFGHIIEIVTNGLIRSVEHRAVTNSVVARTTIVTFVTPEDHCPIAPAQSLVGKHGRNHLICGSFLFKEFFRVFVAMRGDRERTMEAFMIKLN